MDPNFTQLTVPEGQAMRRICGDAMNALGHGAELSGDSLQASDGRVYGLETVARAVAGVPQNEWRAMIEDYFDRMTAKPNVDAMAAGQLLARTRAKIIDPALVTQEQAGLHYKYAGWVGGLPLLMAYDADDTIIYLRDEHVQRAGGEQAWEAARKNLLVEGPGTPERASDEDGGTFLGIMSESEFQASWLAFPEELLDGLGLVAGAHGIFLTAPAATALNLHIIDDETNIADILFMARVTGAQHNGMPHPLSPHVYWWNGGQVQPITGIAEEGLALTLPEDLEFLLER